MKLIKVLLTIHKQHQEIEFTRYSFIYMKDKDKDLLEGVLFDEEISEEKIRERREGYKRGLPEWVKQKMK